MTNFNPNNTMPIEEGQALYEDRAQRAISELTYKGFGGAKPPLMSTSAGNMPYQGHIPANLPEMSDNELGYYMGLLSEWNNYVQQQLAEASVNFTKAKAILEHVEANLRIAYQVDENDRKRSNPERDDYMTSDRRYVEAKSSVIYWDTLYTSIRAVANSAEQAFAAVSRRITQRGQEIDRTNRVGGTTQQTNIAPGPMFGGRRG